MVGSNLQHREEFHHDLVEDADQRKRHHHSLRGAAHYPHLNEIGSLERIEGREATRLPSPPSRRTVTLTSGTDGAIRRADNMETGSTGCRVNAEETRTVRVEGPSFVRKNQRTPKVGKKECPICRQTVTIMKRHVEAKHLPWYFSPDLACWQCRFAEETTVKLWGTIMIGCVPGLLLCGDG